MVLQTALSSGAFLPYAAFTLETGGTFVGSKPMMDNYVAFTGNVNFAIRYIKSLLS